MPEAHLEQLGVHQRQLDHLSQLAHLVAQTADTGEGRRAGVFERHLVHLSQVSIRLGFRLRPDDYRAQLVASWQRICLLIVSMIA